MEQSHSSNNNTSNSSNFHSLCIEAGFNETNFPPPPSDKTTPASINELIESNYLLTNKVTGFGNDIKLLNEENNSLKNQLLSQKTDHCSLEMKIQELEKIINDLKNKDVSSRAISENKDIVKDGKTAEIEKKQVDFETQLNAIVTDLGGVSKKLDTCCSHMTDTSKVVYRLESEIQKFVRRHSLVIENLCPKEDNSVMDMLMVFVGSVLNVKLEESDIESLHVIDRLPAESTSSTPERRMLPRPVLVTFTCYKTQAQIYKYWLSFRSKNMVGSLSKERGQGLTVNEYLTEAQDNIYKEALKLKEKHLVVDCWTYKGKTYIKKLDGTVTEFSNSNEIVKSESSSCVVM